ncbi:tRNA preQ1(34) S-adenosylmethionine ribosyltransferase-isomerase QueA [Hydrogenimonas urashimensis]|uniref:tRNA preQ1(34) S-adenosylmethionine ribosyltransferase-isomerase QueA n=1 Tax=Hydrogenimonas urashimensis TaxID=2740515 RepID=UPI0019164443|nr:tRNA preQ1(34) S-adenosylmethionine ribosyltransferase-isomerase QueA [Hydrogenimonas urashimensis]
MNRLSENRVPDLLATESYDYRLPPELIATEPANPKESARLLVVERKKGTITHTTFRNLLSFIPKGCSVVYNDTKVIKARLFGKKQSGGKVELLINKQLDAQRYSVLIRGKVRPGSVLLFGESLQAEVLELCADGSRVVRFMDGNGEILTFEALLHRLDRFGHVPLPPYIQREEREEDTLHYQPVFARQEGAVAAPTASLHFTEELFNKMRKSFDIYPITLHVGAGTFKPVETERITDHPMHSEYYEIPEKTRALIDSGRELLAIGTTVARTIEYYVRTKKSFGECDLFLHPGNPPRRVDHLLTNFHLPKSTLIMLVASFLGLEKTMEVYRCAIQNRYRFYSYGDAMLIL